MQGRTVLLQTERLILREYTTEDYAALRTVHGDHAVQAMRGGSPLSEQETRDEIAYVLAAQQEHPRTRYQWLIETLYPTTFVGYCRLQITNRRVGIAEIGYFLHREAWGQGYATEAANAMVNFGFAHLNLHRISTGCISTNIGSARVMEKIGMRAEGRLREDRLVEGVHYDTLLYAMFRHDWQPIKEEA